jgi:cobalt-precorrin 5A hydrolase
MKIAIIALTVGGKILAQKINRIYTGAFVDTSEAPVFDKLAGLWTTYDAIICIMATGIVVRGIAPLCEDKKRDPCVLVLDEKGQFVISLLSGHLGGGNTLSRSLAAKLGAQAVITTASDVTGHTALDLWARRNNLQVEEYQKLTTKSAKLVNSGSLNIYTDCDCKSLPPDFNQISDAMAADIIVSDRVFKGSEALILRPCALAVGLGCNRGTTAYDFEVAVNELFRDSRLNRRSIQSYSSIDLKQDEQGLLDFVSTQGLPITFYSKEQLNGVDGVSSSAVVFKATGAKGVAEPAALLEVSGPETSGTLIVRKRKWKDVTAAVATKRIRLVA